MTQKSSSAGSLWAWKEQHLRYVLLVGDADLVPVRYMVLDRITRPRLTTRFILQRPLLRRRRARATGALTTGTRSTRVFTPQYFGEVRGEKNKSDPINYDAVGYRPDHRRRPLASEHGGASPPASPPNPCVTNGQRAGQGSSAAVFLAWAGWVDGRECEDLSGPRLPPAGGGQSYYGEGGNRNAAPQRGEHRLQLLLMRARDWFCHTGHGGDTAGRELYRSHL